MLRRNGKNLSSISKKAFRSSRLWVQGVGTSTVFAKMVLCEYARVYLERDQEGDREKAHNLLNQALEIFQKMGAKKEIEKIIAKKKLLTA